MKTLQDQKAIVLARKEELENRRGDIYVREEQAIANTVLPFFSGFNPEVTIEVTRGSVYFKMDHPDYSYKKELFNLYLRENWSEDGRAYNGVDISYYTTSTKGVNSWELKRLRMLGDLAEIVLKDQEEIVTAVNNVVVEFKAEYKEVYAEMEEVGKELREIEYAISIIKHNEIKALLLTEGIEFKKAVELKLKFNYTVRVKKVKLTDITKSGKSATVVFEYEHHNQTSREENINVEKIISQVLDYSSNVELEIA